MGLTAARDGGLALVGLLLDIEDPGRDGRALGGRSGSSTGTCAASDRPAGDPITEKFSLRIDHALAGRLDGGEGIGCWWPVWFVLLLCFLSSAPSPLASLAVDGLETAAASLALLFNKAQSIPSPMVKVEVDTAALADFGRTTPFFTIEGVVERGVYPGVTGRDRVEGETVVDSFFYLFFQIFLHKNERKKKIIFFSKGKKKKQEKKKQNQKKKKKKKKKK
jgi:hypothetical protein